MVLLLSIISSCSATARDLQQQGRTTGLVVTVKDVRAYARTMYKWDVETDIDKPVATFALESSDAAATPPKGPGSNQQQIG